MLFNNEIKEKKRNETKSLAVKLQIDRDGEKENPLISRSVFTAL